MFAIIIFFLHNPQHKIYMKTPDFPGPNIQHPPIATKELQHKQSPENARKHKLAHTHTPKFTVPTHVLKIAKNRDSKPAFKWFCTRAHVYAVLTLDSSG